MKWVSLSCSFPEQVVSATGSKSFRIQVLILSVLGFHLLGCAPSLGDAKPPFDSPLAITAQPRNQTVPLGLAATFSANVTGSPIQYQWNRNGSPIPGATGSTYTTPATVTTDAGSIFTVTVSNNTFGKVTSSPASLTLTGRAPKAGDLRFQQVDAAFTLNGYDDGGTSETTLSGRYIYHYGGTGTPLFLGPGHCLNSPLTDGVGCSWEFQQFQLPSNISTPGIQYASDFYSNLQSDMQLGTNTPFGAISYVVTSLDLEQASNQFAASWIPSLQGNFDSSQQTVSLANLQAAATQEGAHSRVITAISFDSGSVVYFSYGWQQDPSTIYEANVVTSTFASVASNIANLAAQGYILTAMTPSGSGGNYILVGTRVQGDTLARPLMTVTQSTPGPISLTQKGYAIVAVLSDPNGSVEFIGER